MTVKNLFIVVLSLLIFATDATPAGVGETPVVVLRDRLWNYPNPFNPTTTIAFELANGASTRIRIFDVSGRLVRELVPASYFGPGQHERVWNGQDDEGRQVSTGVYFYRLEAGVAPEFTG